MNWCDRRARWCSNTVYLVVCSDSLVLWCLGRSGMLFSTACMLWHIFNAYLPVAGAPSFTCRWLLNMSLPCTRKRGQKVEGGKFRVISGLTRFATDGYCLEFQGRDLMLRSPSISCRLWINQMKHKLLYCKYSHIRLQATVNVNWNHITSATGRDTCDYSCSREHLGDWSFIHGGTSASISLQVCVTEVDFLHSLSTLFTLLRTRGDILSVYAPFLLPVSSQPISIRGAARVPVGEASAR